MSVCAHFLPTGLFREGNVAERYLARAASLLKVDKSIHPQNIKHEKIKKKCSSHEDLV